jgi:hypothetical protein
MNDVWESRMKYRFELRTADGFKSIPDQSEVHFRSSLYGGSQGYFTPSYGEVGDYIHAINEEGDVVAGFFVVRPEDYLPEE